MKKGTNLWKVLGGNQETSKKPSKHDANLQKRPLLHFQIGLILALMAAYFVLEVETPMRKKGELAVVEEPIIDNATYVNYVPEPEPIPEEPVEEKPQEEKPVLGDEFKEVDNDSDVKETKVDTPETKKPSDEFDAGKVNTMDEEEDPGPVPFILVEVSPIYPGCEGLVTNGERKKCMSDKLGKLIRRKFNTSIASEYGLSGVQKIFTTFTIDKNGEVSDVTVKAPHAALEKEARRVIGKVPKMIPGKQRDSYVNVAYSIPIIFKAL